MRPIPWRPPIVFSCFHDREGWQPLAIDAHRHPRLESHGDLLQLIRGCLGRDGHAEFDGVDTIDREVFQLAGLVADVQTILIRAVRLGDRRFDRDLFLLAIGNHLRSAGEPLAKRIDAPRGDHLNVGRQRVGGELEATLVIALAGGTVGERRGSLLTGDFQALLGDQRPGNRRPQQVDRLVLRSPREHREGKIATQFVAHIDDARRRRTGLEGFLQSGFTILAGLTQVHVQAMHLVALLEQPAQDHRGVESARISQNTTRHRSSFLVSKTDPDANKP